jgi:hypothetical protein
LKRYQPPPITFLSLLNTLCYYRCLDTDLIWSSTSPPSTASSPDWPTVN